MLPVATVRMARPVTTMSDTVVHNEMVPGQHEISLIFALGDASADQNASCQDVCSTVLWFMG